MSAIAKIGASLHRTASGRDLLSASSGHSAVPTVSNVTEAAFDPFQSRFAGLTIEFGVMTLARQSEPLDIYNYSGQNHA